MLPLHGTRLLHSRTTLSWISIICFPHYMRLCCRLLLPFSLCSFASVTFFLPVYLHCFVCSKLLDSRQRGCQILVTIDKKRTHTQKSVHPRKTMEMSSASEMSRQYKTKAGKHFHCVAERFTRLNDSTSHCCEGSSSWVELSSCTFKFFSCAVHYGVSCVESEHDTYVANENT